MIKRYITFFRKKENENFYSDPNTNWKFDRLTVDSKFYETPYEVNWTFLAYVEYPDNTLLSTIDNFIVENSEYNFTFLTEEEANEFLSNLWDVSVKDFIFTDNRPLEIY